MPTIHVIFENSTYNYFTSVSKNSTKEALEKYFVNQSFNVGIYPSEKMQKCTSIKFVK